MKKYGAFIFMTCFVFCVQAQNFGVSSPITISADSGNYHPQIEVLGDGELGVIWTDALSNNLYFARRNGIDQFMTPIQLNPVGIDVQDYNWSGADLAVEGNNVYVVFRSLGYETGHNYLVKSSDNGLTFSAAVQVDDMINDYGQFPDVAVFNDTVYVTYMKHGFVTMNPQFVLSRSVDGGATFEPEVDVTNWLGDEACDCCQGEIIVDANRIIIFYRENVLNTRDIKAVVSHDRGATFTEYLSIDNHNWVIAACPSSGPDARFISNDVIVSAYKTSVSSVSKLFLNEFNVTTGLALNEIDVYMTGATNSGINYPQVSVANNLLGVVWEGLGTSTDVFFNASSTGVTGILPENAINLTNLTSSQSKPDIVILNGAFHIVYAELSGTKVQYCRVNSMTEIAEQNANVSIIYPNPTNGFVKILFEDIQQQWVSATILTSNGQYIETVSASSNFGFLELDLSHLATGIYFVQITGDDQTEVHRIVKY